METKDTLLKILQSKIIAYHSDLAKAFQSPETALFLSQLLYWSGKENDPEGWIYKTQKNMYDETGLKRARQETVRKILTDKKIIQVKLFGSPPKLHYKIDYDKLIEFMKKYYEQIELLESSKLNCTNPTNQNAGIKQIELLESSKSSLHKNTTKNTSKNTTLNGNSIENRIIRFFNNKSNKNIKLTEQRKKNIRISLKDYTYKEFLYGIINMNRDIWSIENKEIRIERLIERDKRDKNFDKWLYFPFPLKSEAVKKLNSTAFEAIKINGQIMRKNIETGEITPLKKVI